MEKAVDVLFWFAAHSAPARFSDVCRALGLSKAGMHRLLLTLANKELVFRNPHDGTYCLGPGIARLSASVLSPHKLVAASTTTMQRLWDAFGETILLSVRIGLQRVCVSQLESPRPLRYALPLGTPFPLYCGSTGKVLLAMMDDAEIERYLASTPLVALGPNTITDAKQLLRDIADIRARGYAVSFEETGVGGGGASAPIFSAEGRCIAALSFYAPKARLSSPSLNRTSKLLVEAANEIANHMKGNRSATMAR